jgi:uncharacterized membrane protein
MNKENTAAGVVGVLIGGVLTFLSATPDAIEKQNRYVKVDDQTITINRVISVSQEYTIAELKADIASLDARLQSDLKPDERANVQGVRDEFAKHLEAAQGLGIDTK